MLGFLGASYTDVVKGSQGDRGVRAPRGVFGRQKT